MEQNRQSSEYVVLADCAVDMIVLPDEEVYKTIAEAVRSLEEGEEPYSRLEVQKARAIFRLARDSKVSIIPKLGGPVFNIAQYLRARERHVSAVSVIGKNQESKRYSQALKELGVNIKYLRAREGKMPKCIYVYHSPTEQLPPVWIGNVSDEPYPIPGDFLNGHDVMIFSATNPDLAVRASAEYRKILAYNPGQVFDYLSFEQTRFEKIIPKVTILSTNEGERDKIVAGMGMKQIRDLFSENRRLEFIITTLAENGSELHLKNGESYRLDASELSWSIDPKDIVDDIGAGDAYFATAVDLIMRGMSPQDILMSATLVAQQSLKYRGGADPRLRYQNPARTDYHAVRRINGGQH